MIMREHADFYRRKIEWITERKKGSTERLFFRLWFTFTEIFFSLFLTSWSCDNRWEHWLIQCVNDVLAFKFYFMHIQSKYKTERIFSQNKRRRWRTTTKNWSLQRWTVNIFISFHFIRWSHWKYLTNFYYVNESIHWKPFYKFYFRINLSLNKFSFLFFGFVGFFNHLVIWVNFIFFLIITFSKNSFHGNDSLGLTTSKMKYKSEENI